MSRTAFTPAPDPPDETYIVIFSAGREGSTLSHVSYFSINAVEILLITGANVDDPLKLICVLTSDFAPADSPPFASLFPQLAIIVRKIIAIKNVNVFFMIVLLKFVIFNLIILPKFEKSKYFFNLIYKIFTYKSKKVESEK